MSGRIAGAELPESPSPLNFTETLPQLATNCLLIGSEKKADLVWTCDEFLAICEHMRNDNDETFFMIPYRRDDGVACFAKAKNARASRRGQWAWDTVTGKAKNPASIGFYPRNADGKTRWGAFDFDAHDGDAERARRWAFDAFQLLLRQPQLFLVLCTSGSEKGGWHLFVFTRGFHPLGDWTRLFKQVAAWIGATVGKGFCEIFPSETRGRTGYAIRAPGAWNPKHDSFPRIAFQNVSSLCLAREKEKSLFISRSSNRVKEGDFTYRKKGGLYRGSADVWQEQFRIAQVSTRREKLKGFVEHTFRQIGREVARKNIELQFHESAVGMNAKLHDHLQEFEELWQWMEALWLAELCALERQRLESLSTQNERDAFRIIQSYARKAADDGFPDFKIHAENLGDRLGISLAGACGIRRKLTEKTIIEQTAAYVPNRLAARFKWIADREIEQPF
jgi:hypothetical protein